MTFGCGAGRGDRHEPAEVGWGIAAETGTEANPVRRARKTTGKPSPVGKCTGRDGRQRKMAAETA